LNSSFSFSFAVINNPSGQFGVLRVLNDDRGRVGKDFGSHPHDNWRSSSIPLRAASPMKIIWVIRK